MSIASLVTWPRVALAGAGAAGLAVLVDGPADALDKVRTAGRLARRSIEDPHQARFVVDNLAHPWLARLGYAVYDDATARQGEHFGAGAHLDDDADAFRHAWAAALMTLRAMRDHDASPTLAGRLVVGLGDAHERDGADNARGSAEMDRRNNRAGVDLVGNGRRGDGWISEARLEQQVLDAVRGGELVRVGAAGALVPTGG